MEPTNLALSETVKLYVDDAFAQWCVEHTDSKHNLPIRGRLYGALIVLSNLEQAVWQFSELAEAVSTDSTKFFGLRSIKNHTNSRVSSVLLEHGFDQLAPTASRGELGRTSTGTKIAGLQLIHLIRDALAQCPVGQIDEQGSALVSYLYQPSV